MGKLKQLFTIIFNVFIFLVLNGIAFTISPIFGLLFFFSFAFSIYNKEIKRKPWKILFIFVGGLITRFALGKIITTFPNYEITLDFAVSAIMLILIFVLGWKIKRK